MANLLLATNDTSFPGNYQLTDDLEDDYMGDNLTNSHFPEQHPITEFIEYYSIPVLCMLGLTGNTVASIVFLQKSLRNSSSSIFLATRGFSDNGFISTLFIIWLSRTFQLHLGAISGICRVIIFLSNVCGCVSAWLVVFVTIENYIRICKPFIVNRVCKTKTAKIAVFILIIVAVGIYNFPFWAMDGQVCQPYMEYMNLVQGLVYADTIITLVVPLVCITIFMTAIVCDLIKSYNRRSRLRAPTLKRVKNPMANVTKMLLSVSVTFFIFNVPSHVNRLRGMISPIINGTVYQSANDQAIQQVLLVISYLSLSINVFVYTLFGSKFRKVMRETYCGQACIVSKRSTEVNDDQERTKLSRETYSEITGQTVEIKLSPQNEQIL